ncbi:MAG: trypsin-like peptidase domain-containing protein [Alphaproteobacteria bacterium]|nr:trypsin-like peptidase domain-containing protein [Alphaproteobacteria bacterium]
MKLGPAFVFAAVAAIATATSLPQGNDARADAPLYVHCYDEERGVLHKRRVDNCAGRVLSNTEADTVRAALKAKRLKRLKRAMQPRAERNKGPRGHGTGFFVTRDGHIITNNHVIEKCKGDIWADSTDGRASKTRVLDTDKRNDLALLKATFPPRATAIFQAPVRAKKGEDIVVIGYGTHKLAPIKPHVTKGIFEMTNPAGTRFRMDAAVRPGNSGGPVLDSSGHVIGVVFAQVNTVNTYKSTGKMVLDKGFAITNPLVFRLLEKNEIAYTRISSGSKFSSDQIFKASKSFITRISCKR